MFIHLVYPVISLLSYTPSALFPPSQPTNPSCGETQCNSHGTCVAPPVGGSDLVCDCKLGYQGKFCEDTINGALSVPLTLSVFGIIIGLVILAFVVAKLQRKKKKKQRYWIISHHRRNIVSVGISVESISLCYWQSSSIKKKAYLLSFQEWHEKNYINSVLVMSFANKTALRADAL